MAASSNQARVLVQLREMILRGTFAGGARLAEIALATQLGVSRTPVKLALTALAQEGLVEALPGGGYAARRLSKQDLNDGVVVRGALEGVAARLLAEQGMGGTLEAELRRQLAAGDALLHAEAARHGGMSYDGYVAYGDMNDAFHLMIMTAADNDALFRAWELNNRLPSASPSATLSLHSSGEAALRMLTIAHDQHHALLDAILRRQSARAFAIAEEHVARATVSIDHRFPTQFENAGQQSVNTDSYARET